MHALIIEDDSHVALVIEEYLEQLGFLHFTQAETEAAAIAAAKTRIPDLITADYGLKEGTGLAAVEAISKFASVPVVYISGSPERLAHLKQHPVVAKPFTEQDLTRAVAKALAGRTKTARGGTI
jgi:CheY-like chemotaxis protein